jgi:hypothetical protein
MHAACTTAHDVIIAASTCLPIGCLAQDKDLLRWHAPGPQESPMVARKPST